MSATTDLSRLCQIVDASGVSARIEAMLPLGIRPRQLSARSLLIGMLACLADHRPAHLVRVHEALIGLPESEKRRLGVVAQWKTGPHELTYRQVERTFGLLVKALSNDHPDGQPSQTLSEIMDALIEASIKVLGVPESSSLAIDWSDYESFARPPRKPRGTDQAQQTAEPAPLDTEDTQEQAQQHENQQECADPEASWGHRNVNHPGKSESFFGYYLQAATIVKEEGGPEAPELVRRITLASCAHDPPAQIAPVIERMASEGIKLGDLTVDSGYSYRQAETFAVPMRAAGAKLVMDIHPNDRGMKGTHQGAIIANGNLYCPATPKALFELGPSAPAATEPELTAHDQKTAELARYKLSPLNAPDQDGYHRTICPAAAGKLRCPLRPSSMQLPYKHPTVMNPPEHPPACCKQKTITVPPTVGAKSAQKHDYPSKAHRSSYNRRTASERSFSQLYDPASNNISRGWSRLIGLTPNTLLLSCVFVIANIRTADAFAARQAEDKRRHRCGLPPKRRRRRRRRDTTHQPTHPNANTPPT